MSKRPRQQGMNPPPQGSEPRLFKETDMPAAAPVIPLPPKGFAPVPKTLPRDNWQEIFVPVHGLIRLTRREMRVLDHPAVQRLGDIFQLGQTYLVFRGATHKRLEHALGALHVSQLFIEAIERNSGIDPPRPEDIEGEWQLDLKLTDVEQAFTRLGALLHDVGHLPAGHTLEDELGLLNPHDGDGRLNLILDRKEWHGTTCCRTLRELINAEYTVEARSISGAPQGTSAAADLTPSEVLLLLISKDHCQAADTPQFRLRVCRDIIGNTICADLLDYLHRDWLHVGKRRELDLRLLEYTEIRRSIRPAAPLDTRLVINLRGAHRVRTDAVTAILDLLESRYQLAEVALFHRAKLCAAGMLERAISELADCAKAEPEWLSQLPEKLLDFSDCELLGYLAQECTRLMPRTDKNPLTERLRGARKLVTDLRVRHLHKELLTRFAYQLSGRAKNIQTLYVGSSEPGSAKQAARNRLDAVQHLESDFGLPPGSIAMYCPPKKMNTKIAEVQVLVHQDVYALDAFESESDDRDVTGGHLRAQQKRFQRLWRVMFAIDETVREELRTQGRLDTLCRAIEVCVLGKQPDAASPHTAAVSLARELSEKNVGPLAGKSIHGRVAARAGETLAYPTGVQTLRSLAQ
jgi:HD superfamily phosphohydrolase